MIFVAGSRVAAIPSHSYENRCNIPTRETTADYRATIVPIGFTRRMLKLASRNLGRQGEGRQIAPGIVITGVGFDISAFTHLPAARTHNGT